MTLRRKLLILVGVFQIIAFGLGGPMYLGYGIKSAHHFAGMAWSDIKQDLDAHGLLVQPRTREQDLDIWRLSMKPIVREIRRASGNCTWPLLGLLVGGPIILTLGLLPERRPAGSQPGG